MTMCMKDHLFDFIIGNVSGVRKPNNPNPESGVVAAAITKAQPQERGNPKPLKVKEMMSKMAMGKEELVRLQEEDSTLQNFKEAKETKTRKGIQDKKRGGMDMCWRKDKVGDTRKQILVPKLLRAKVMEVVHNS